MRQRENYLPPTSRPKQSPVDMKAMKSTEKQGVNEMRSTHAERLNAIYPQGMPLYPRRHMILHLLGERLGPPIVPTTKAEAIDFAEHQYARLRFNSYHTSEVIREYAWRDICTLLTGRDPA